MLSFSVQTPLPTQLFLPEILHIVTMLLGAELVVIRQIIYGITMNTVQALVSASPSGDVDAGALQDLQGRLSTPDMVRNFGLNSQSLTMAGLPVKEVADNLLESVEQVARCFGEILAAGAISMG